MISGCMTTSGKKCVFPFKYRERTCSGPKCCNLDNDPEGDWCATKVKENGFMFTSKSYGYCDNTCKPPGKRMVLCSRQNRMVTVTTHVNHQVRE